MATKKSSSRGNTRRSSQPRGQRAVPQSAKVRRRGKVGSDPHAAKSVGGKGDFGVHEADVTERQYVSQAVKHADPGAQPPHSIGAGDRVSGAGGNASGPGASSGGDLDTDIIGVGTGGSGVATSGTHGRPPGPDDYEGPSPSLASGGPARGRAEKAQRGRRTMVRGSTVDRSGGDASTSGAGRGSAATNDPAERNDDSFAGEISNDDASGADNTASDRQG